MFYHTLILQVIHIIVTWTLGWGGIFQVICYWVFNCRWIVSYTYWMAICCPSYALKLGLWIWVIDLGFILLLMIIYYHAMFTLFTIVIHLMLMNSYSLFYPYPDTGLVSLGSGYYGPLCDHSLQLVGFLPWIRLVVFYTHVFASSWCYNTILPCV